MKRDSLLSACALLLGICSLGHALIAMGTTRWKYDFTTGAEFGLFEKCAGRRVDCVVSIQQDSDYVKATASFMIIGGVFLFTALVISVYNIFKDLACQYSTAFYFTAGLCFLIACSVYTGVVRNEALANITFGFSLWLGWASVAVTFLAGCVQGSAIKKQ